MPKIITFGTKEYLTAIRRLNNSVHDMEFIPYYDYQLRDLYKAFPNHFVNSKGFGWWLWKPFIIDFTLSKMEEDDILIYLDSTIEIIKDPLNLIKEGEDMVLFNNGQNHHEYCKSECYYGMETPSSLDQLQANGAIQIYRNTPLTRIFVEEYFTWCSQLDLINDDYLESVQLSKFKEHRHDQSILTNLAVKYNIKLKTSPCQWGMKDNSYFNHHRTL